jgi:hypothetical protein
MKFKLLLIALVLTFSTQSFATNVDEWTYTTKKGDLKPTPGCKNKEKASKNASSGHRFKKYTKLLCNDIGYGWAYSKVVDRGEVVCEPCDGDYEGTEKYRCNMMDVVVECKQVAR